MQRVNTAALTAAVLLFVVVAGVSAQSYPNRPVRFIVPYAAGGAGDIFARVLGQKMGEAMGQQFIIDNRPGANGIIGTEMVAKSAPDGYTIVMGNSGPFVVNPSLYRKLPYDSVRDFAPVTQGTYYAYLLIVHPSMPVRTVSEFITYAKARPKQLSYGSSGLGSSNHLAGEFFGLFTDTKLNHVPYKGSAIALAEVLAGQIPLMFDTPITSIPMIRAGKVRVLGYTGKQRASQLPEVATLDELGLKGYEVSSWQAIVAPAGTPKAAIDRLHLEAVKALKMPDVIERLSTQGGNDLVGNTPEQFAELIRKELAQYSALIRKAGISAE